MIVWWNGLGWEQVYESYVMEGLASSSAGIPQDKFICSITTFSSNIIQQTLASTGEECMLGHFWCLHVGGSIIVSFMDGILYCYLIYTFGLKMSKAIWMAMYIRCCILTLTWRISAARYGHHESFRSLSCLDSFNISPWLEAPPLDSMGEFAYARELIWGYIVIFRHLVLWPIKSLLACTSTR